MHGLINYIDTKKPICQLLQVIIRHLYSGDTCWGYTGKKDEEEPEK
jgi:hypothetical protein